MRNLKRVLSLALALVMVLGMMVITTSAAAYTDAEEITYTEAVDVMSAIGILKGMGDGTFAPKGTLTREQAAKILAFVTMGAEADEYLTGSAAPFDDVAATKWSAKYVAYCKNLGIIDGVGNNKFNPAGTLTVVQFAKMLLVAIEAEGTFTGAGWEANVKTAFNGVDELKATGIKVSNAEITREEACELALAAMKAGEDYSNGYYIEGKEDLGYSETYADAYIMAVAMKIEDPTILKHTDTRDSLLEDVYGFECKRDADAFGRPGTLYTNNKTGAEKVELWFQDTAAKDYVGEVKGGTVFADLGAPKAAQSYTAYVDGVKLGAKSSEMIATSIAKDSKTNAVLASVSGEPVAQTGNGVVTEIYAAGENAWTIVVINTYADTVKKVTEANEEKEIKACTELTGGLKYEAAELAEDDAVLYTVAKGEIQTIVKNETVVAGTPTKNANDVWTIGEGAYAVSFTAGELGLALGTKGEWYADAYGNLIAAKGDVKTETKDEWIYAVVLETGAVNYEKAEEGTLTTEGKDAVEAKELIKVKTAADEVVVLSTGWEYTEDDDGNITGVEFKNGSFNEDGEYNATIGAGELVKYTVDKDGKIAKIEALADQGSDTDNFTVTKGAAVLGNYGKFGTDETVYFLTDGDKYDVYVGYANVPTKTGTLVAWEHDKNVVSAVLLSVEKLTVDTKGDDHYVYVADDSYTAEWDAENEVVVNVYEGLYVDGVKTTLTFEAEKAPELVKGAMYAYNTKSGIVTTDLLTGTATVNSIQSGFFRAGSTITYTDADTAYVQIDGENYTIADATGLPAIKDYTVTILKVDSKDDVATTVYFSAVEIEE